VFRWRHSGQQIPLEQFGEVHWSGVHASFIYESHSDSELFASALAYAADPRHGFCYVAVGMLASTGTIARDALCNGEAAALLVEFLFTGWNFRRVYIEVAEYNAGQSASLHDRLEQVGHLPDHLYLGGRYWSLGTWMIERDQWHSLREVILDERRAEPVD
jgi:hypothetical protein